MTDDLQDAADDLHDLDDFYTNQKPAWDRLRTAMARFGPNRTDLEKDDTAARALQKMDGILNADAPYGLLKDADDLISAVESINSSLVEKQREKTGQDIEASIYRVKAELDQAKADDDLRNKTLYPFQQLKKKIEKESSIPQIAYAIGEAQDAFEQATEKIEAYKHRDDKEPIKPTKTINPATLAKKTYIESEKDVEEYIEVLRKTLMDAIAANTRIRIK